MIGRILGMLSQNDTKQHSLLLAHVHPLLNPEQGYKFDRYGFLLRVHRYIHDCPGSM